jgi:hypothetical protein
MARVNIEERFFAEHRRLERFAKLMGWHRQRAQGCLLDLWHDSQEAMKSKGSAEEIAFWSRLDDLAETSKLVTSLSDRLVRFIRKAGPDLYEISGNSIQIKNLIGAVRRSKQGGRAFREKMKRLKEQQSPKDDASLEAGLQPGLNDSSPAQGSAVQTSAGQPNTTQGSAPAKRPTVTDEAVAICEDEWLRTLTVLGCPRGNALPHEHELIGRAIQMWGARAVEAAIVGARFEPKSTEFDPRKNVSLERVLPVNVPPGEGRQRKFDRFMNMGMEALNEGKAVVSWMMPVQEVSA